MRLVWIAFLLAACSDDSGSEPLVVSSPTDVSVTEPDPASFVASFEGTPPFAVVWQGSRDGVTWTDVSAVRTFPSEPAVTTLDLAATSLADDGMYYRAVAANAVESAGVPTHAAQLSVAPVSTAPALLADLRDVAVPEGATAMFSPMITGSALTYEWEEALPSGAFTTLAGETGPVLVRPAVTLAMNLRRYRVTARNSLGVVTSREATLFVFGSTETAQVFVQHGGPNVVIPDAALATAMAPGRAAVADLATGTFSATADGMGTRNSLGWFAYAGVLRELIFVNTTGADVTIAAGAIHADVAASFAHTRPPTGVGIGCTVQANLFAVIDGVNYSAGGRQQNSVAYFADGTLTANSGPRFETFAINNGGTAVASTSTLSAFAMQLTLPALTLPAGKRMRFSFTLNAMANDYFLVNASTTPATIHLALPAGVVLDRNTTVPLGWVTN